MYAQGGDVPRDLVRAYAWLHRAAEKNSPNAQLILEVRRGVDDGRSDRRGENPERDF